MATSTITNNAFNKIGQSVDIHTYNSISNRYVCPSDGYLDIGVKGSGGRVQVYMYGTDSDENTHRPVIYLEGGSDWIFTPVYVHRGMKVYCEVISGSFSEFRFFPLS